jgi:hypothetical protein
MHGMDVKNHGKPQSGYVVSGRGSPEKQRESYKTYHIVVYEAVKT